MRIERRAAAKEAVMAEYQRFIAYLYEYGQDGIKHSAGHLRVELRQGNCRMTVKVRAKKTEGSCKLYLYIRKPGTFTGFPIGETEIVHGEAEFCFEADASNLDGQGNSFEPVCGILLFGNTTGYLAADWNNQEVTPKEANQVRTAEGKSQSSAEIPNRKLEEKKPSRSDTMAEGLRDVTETKKTWEIESKNQTEGNQTDDIKTKEICSDNYKDNQGSARSEQLSIEKPDSDVKMEALSVNNNTPDKKNTNSKKQMGKEDIVILKEISANSSFSEKSDQLTETDKSETDASETDKFKTQKSEANESGAEKSETRNFLSENKSEHPTEGTDSMIAVSKEDSLDENLQQPLEYNNVKPSPVPEVSDGKIDLEKKQQTVEKEENSSKEPVPDFWSAAKDIVKNLLNAEQEQDPFDQITAVLHSRRRGGQPENNAMSPASAGLSAPDKKTSAQAPTHDQETSGAEVCKESSVLQKKKESDTFTEMGEKKDSSLPAAYNNSGQKQMQTVQSETGILKSSGFFHTEKGSNNAVTSEEAKGKNVPPAFEKSGNLPAGQSPTKLQKEAERQVISSQQMAEKETAAANAGTAIKGANMASLNAAAQAYCGNRRLPWQDAPEARELLDTCMKMYPFQDGELAECVRVEPKDIGRLPMEYWNLGNNSFLLHGYCSYKYLLFAKRMNRIRCEYLLMVPGIYQQREKMMARMFGFEQFKCARRREQRQGEFGYWYMTLIF